MLTPVYEFRAGLRKPEAEWRLRRLGENEVLLIEGIHALNPRLTETVAENKKFRIFINALTQLCIDDHNRIRTSDARLVRRIVRDRRYRNYSAATSILRWPKVRAGEEKHIFPFHGEDARYIAIESNPRTREMYARFSIPCFWVTEEGTCLTEGTRIVKRLPR